MSVIGDFTVPAETFALEYALSSAPEMTVEADRLASHSPMEVFPFLWARGGDFDAFQEGLESDPDIEEASVADEQDEEVLFRLVWEEEFCELVHDMVDHHAAILEATADGSRWKLRLRFAEEGMVTTFQEHFREQGQNFEVNSLRHSAGPRQREYGLTPEQYEALVAAVRGGYFSIPRTASVEDVGESLDISANAVSQRIRRGTETLIRTSLMIDAGELEGGDRGST